MEKGFIKNRLNKYKDAIPKDTAMSFPVCLRIFLIMVEFLF
jgi:Golgi nucleoside diphosphatase